MLFAAYFFFSHVIGVDDAFSLFFRCTKTSKTFRFISANKIFMHSPFFHLPVHSRFCRYSTGRFSRFSVHPFGHFDSVGSGGSSYSSAFSVFYVVLTPVSLVSQYFILCQTFTRHTHSASGHMRVCLPIAPMSRQISKFYLLRPFFAFSFMYFPSQSNGCMHRMTAEQAECRKRVMNWLALFFQFHYSFFDNGTKPTVIVGVVSRFEHIKSPAICSK